jgi:hypothetical protein
MYDSSIYETTEEGRAYYTFATSDVMSYVEWTVTTIDDQTDDDPRVQSVFSATRTPVTAYFEEGEFSVLLKPDRFMTTEITKYYTEFYDRIDNVGGFMGAIELILALFAVGFWIFMSAVDVVDGDFGDDKPEDVENQ